MADSTETKTTENKPVQEQGRAAIRAAAQGATETAQRGAQTFEQAGRSGSEALQRSSEAGAETVRHFSRAASETTRRGTEEIATTGQRFAENAARHFEDTVSRMANVMQESAQEWRSVMQLPRVAGGGFQDVQRSMNSAVEGVIRTNLHAMQEILRMTSPASVAELQQRFMREYLSALLDGGTAIVRAVHRTAEQALQPLEERAQQHQKRMARNGNGGCVADVMEREVKFASPDDSVQQLARLMREEDTGVLPVGEGDRLVGMVTDRDVAVRLVAEGRDPARTKVREVMTPDVNYVFEDEDIEHVAENMAQQQVRRLPVMNRQKRLVGVVSLGDIAQGQKPHLVGKAMHGIARQGGQHTQTAAE